MSEKIDEEVKKRFRFPKKNEALVFMVDGKPMELPPSLKRYIEERFGKSDPNYTIIKKPWNRKMGDKEETK